MATLPTDPHGHHDERRPFFTSKQLADYLALSERTVRELLRTGAIPSYKVSGARRIDPADVDIWLAGCREEGKAA
jgi:excisionase family DNA binding protein